MWESPIYKFKTEINGKKEDIFIDVTGSAPNFSKPMKQLEGTFDVLFKDLEPSKTKILDFGAAKLRNTLHLLEKGYTVYSCEFEDLFKRSKQANEFYEKAKKFDNFKPLIFPHEFIDLDEKFDVVLVINVLNIMPVSIERFHVLALCRKKMKDNGRLLWYTQHGTYSESDAVTKLFDGLVTGKGRKYHMFYRDFSRKEIHDMLKSTGFSFNKKFKFPTSGTNQAYVFNADGDVLIELSKREIKRKLKSIERKVRWEVDKEDVSSEKVIYQTGLPTRASIVKKINVLEEYIKELAKINPGKKGASKYHQLIFNILKPVFDYCLKKPEMEEYIAKDTQRVDITFKNHRETGFFKELDEGYHLTCPNIFMECKNYNEDLGNPEFAQIQNRLNKLRGQLGIIVCRKITNEENIKKRQENLIRDEKYIIVLDDSDIKQIVTFKLESKEEKIDEFLDNKFKQLI